MDVRALVYERISGPEPVCLFAYDLVGLRRHVERTVAALPARCSMYYAMKANSAGPVLECLAPLVAGFEVASGGEIEKVRAVSADAPILFGGPAKTPSELALALKSGVTRIHAESVLELYRISAAAVDGGVVVEVALRVNLAGPLPEATLAMAGRPTQFGISEDDLPTAIEAATTLPGLRFAGFHLHSLSNNLSATTHLAMLEVYRDTVLAWERRFGVRVEVLDVGGGIGVDYGRPESRFDWEGFCAGLARWVATLPSHWREIQFECGRYLTAWCGRYVAEVLDVKTNHGVSYALVRGGTHHFRLPSSWAHSHPFTVVPVERWESAAPRPGIRDGVVTVTGELCTPKDVLARDAPVPLLRAGDVLVFEQAGAYGWDISHHDFLSHPHPEQVFMGGRGPDSPGS
ncbi:type III PLP-dependent enzyme [Actinomycetospora endophytica]|uniref:Type III PLP-dependent enzyme n=1 Tax=Actinomycetospora endophytica TaxID=2291215 RepID=A0ABS8PCX7_9PSEU|nr:type III PLP-dependent enzyme [Actinomycetospora endophytica]MCD2195757.1 type III PLP-dependent enzyme [Actinomycetospora endophytica]